MSKPLKTEPTQVRAFRFPLKLWKALRKVSQANGRTIPKEIVFRLMQSLKE